MRVVLLAACSLVVACMPRASAAPEPKLPVGAHLESAESMRASWCVGAERRACENFTAVSVQDIVQFEARFPSILRARGLPREAQLVSGYDRTYWAVLRGGRLYVLGSLVCRERITAEGTVTLEPICPLFSVSFLTGHPESVEFEVY